ncbi:hypothetical protein RRG08_041059 [Elysia crispata]|uniref:Uncharacterized protein n=1 Tax=Elysia crispata TaxID=231223 RepID=A0AAE0Y7M0_9GAST|nr:hypothetical protein RRG08_041059 [Elysia crispata]
MMPGRARPEIAVACMDHLPLENVTVCFVLCSQSRSFERASYRCDLPSLNITPEKDVTLGLMKGFGNREPTFAAVGTKGLWVLSLIKLPINGAPAFHFGAQGTYHRKRRSRPEVIRSCEVMTRRDWFDLGA